VLKRAIISTTLCIAIGVAALLIASTSDTTAPSKPQTAANPTVP